MGVQDAVNEFLKEFVRMCTQITSHEVERAKNQLKTHLLLQLDGTTPACEEIGRHMLVYNRRIPITELLHRIDVIFKYFFKVLMHCFFARRCNDLYLNYTLCIKIYVLDRNFS